MGQLEGRVALITGAARGIGAAEAQLFAHEGAFVVVADVREELGREVAEKLGSSGTFIRLDVTQESDWADAMRQISRFGPLRALVNNAGLVRLAAIEAMSLAKFMEVITVNQVGTFLGIKNAIPAMKQHGGSIVNTSSIAGLESTNGYIAYSASKFAVRGMTKTAALELGRLGIRVNSIHPGRIATDFGETAGIPPGAVSFDYATLPVPRVGLPEEVAAMALFLASDASSYCTGAEFVVDGGHMAGVIAPSMPGGANG